MHYYPYGMTLSGLGTPQVGPEYRCGYNGVELQADFDLNWWDTYYRGLDPALGRWTGVDPKAEMFEWQSPYVAMDDDPVLLNDPNGDCPICPAIPWVLGAIGGGGVIGGIVEVAEGGNFWEGAAKGAIAGGTGALAFYSGGLSLAAAPTTELVVFSGMVSGGSGYAADRLIEGESMTLEGSLSSMIIGGMTGAILQKVNPGNGKLYESGGKTNKVKSAPHVNASKGSLESFDDVVANPKAIWGKSADEVGDILGNGWDRAPLNSGNGWKYVQKEKDGFISFTTGNSHHPNSTYYKINSGASGKTKVVGKGYVHSKGDKSKIIYAE